MVNENYTLTDKHLQKDLFNDEQGRSKRLRTVINDVLLDNDGCCLNDSVDRLNVSNSLIKEVNDFIQSELDSMPVIGENDFVPTSDLEAQIHHQILDNK